MRASRSLAPPTRVATSNSKDLCWSEETRRFYFLLSWKFVPLFLLREELIVTGSILVYFSARFDLLALLKLPLSSDYLVARAAIGLFDPLGLASLGGCLPLPFSLRGSTTRAFSGYRAVLGTRSLDIPGIWCFVVLHVICFRRWNGMNIVRDYEFGRVLRVRLEKPTNHIGGYHTRWSYMLGLSTAAARSDLWRRIEIRVLLQQQYNTSKAFYFEYVRTNQSHGRISYVVLHARTVHCCKV